MRRSFNRLHSADEEMGSPLVVTASDAPVRQRELNDKWRCNYPCTADNFQFDFPRLLNATYGGGVAIGERVDGVPARDADAKRVCVIGAGIAGTLAARELARSGYRVDIVEASNRVGGRTHTTRAPNPQNDGTAQLACYEQGAMRLPFFNSKKPRKAGPGPHVGGPYRAGPEGATSVTEFFAQEYRIATAAFPNPGKAPGPLIFDPLDDNDPADTAGGGAGRAASGSGSRRSSVVERKLTKLRRNVTETGAEASMMHRVHTPEEGEIEYHRSMSSSKLLRTTELDSQENSIGNSPTFSRSKSAAFDPAVTPCVPSYPGVDTGIYVNDGRGVDLETLYPERHIPAATARFMYTWPHDAPHLENWPSGEAAERVRFFHKGQLLEGVAPPPITLVHAVPDDDASVPATFVRGAADFERNVRAWREGVFALRTVLYKWTLFSNCFVYCVGGRRYPMKIGGQTIIKDAKLGDWNACLFDNAATWDEFWVDKVLPHYQNINFAEFAMAGPVLPEFVEGEGWRAPAAWLNGNFGGLGLSFAEVQLFYTIGCGDGSWGAFFPNSALWALRALCFGFATEHQLVLGCLNATLDGIDRTLRPAPDETPQGLQRTTLRDSSGNEFWAPQYAGVASFAECHVFKPLARRGVAAPASKPASKSASSGAAAAAAAAAAAGSAAGSEGCGSLWDLIEAGECGLFTSCRVRSLERLGPERVLVTWADARSGATCTRTYANVICTVPLWNVQTDMTLRGFELPMAVPSALSMSHWIRSAKVFVALKAPYWRQGADDTRAGLLPQVLATNTELQDMYGLCAPTGDEPFPTHGGIALLSYVWEDDSQKFCGREDRALVRMLLERLEQVLAASGLPSFTPFLMDATLEAPGSYTVWRWEAQPEYFGCAKAYQCAIENLNYSLLTFNRVHGASTNLFFAGDAYSLESGWLEPAMRMALDATVHLIRGDARARLVGARGFAYDEHYVAAELLSAAKAQRTAELGPVEVRLTVGRGAALASGGSGGGLGGGTTSPLSTPETAPQVTTPRGMSRVPTKPRLHSQRPSVAASGGGGGGGVGGATSGASSARGTYVLHPSRPAGAAYGGTSGSPSTSLSASTASPTTARSPGVLPSTQPRKTTAHASLPSLSPRGMKAGSLAALKKDASSASPSLLILHPSSRVPTLTGLK